MLTLGLPVNDLTTDGYGRARAPATSLVGLAILHRALWTPKTFTVTQYSPAGNCACRILRCVWRLWTYLALTVLYHCRFSVKICSGARSVRTRTIDSTEPPATATCRMADATRRRQSPATTSDSSLATGGAVIIFVCIIANEIQ
jgi:hypothetical protein